jgi:hypothetical protein
MNGGNLSHGLYCCWFVRTGWGFHCVGLCMWWFEGNMQCLELSRGTGAWTGFKGLGAQWVRFCKVGWCHGWVVPWLGAQRALSYFF